MHSTNAPSTDHVQDTPVSENREVQAPAEAQVHLTLEPDFSASNVDQLTENWSEQLQGASVNLLDNMVGESCV